MSEMATQRIVLSVPGMESVAVDENLVYGHSGEAALYMDVYHPADTNGQATPAVVFVGGYPGPGFAEVMGCNFKEMGAYVSWSQLIAAHGMTAITFENVDPAADARTLMAYVADNAGELGIQPDRIAIWSCSGNTPVGLSLLSHPDVEPRCAVFCYGYLMDLDGSTSVADTAAQFRFVDAMAGRTIDDVWPIPSLIVRAGQDEMPGLNVTLDRYVACALEQNFPLTLINHPEGVHAFDIQDDTEGSRTVIRRIVQFLEQELLG